MKWIDTHAHLYVDRFDDDIDDVVERCAEAGVEEIYLPNIDLQTMGVMDELAQRYPDHLRPMHGLHPCSVDGDFNKLLIDIAKRLEQGGSYGIGETGIDLYWDKTYETEQVDSFVQHIQWAVAYELPIIIHSRQALDLTIALMEQHHDRRLTGIFHCFDGTVDQARRIMDMGCYLGIGGVVTYKKSHLPVVLREIGLERVVLETDAPYLPPVPHRGQRNESSYIPLIGKFIAEVMEIEVEAVAERTTANAEALFHEKK